MRDEESVMSQQVQTLFGAPRSEGLVVGFTGTREGMSERQAAALDRLLATMIVRQFHHGDCVGADAEAATLAQGRGIRVVSHPAFEIGHAMRAATLADLVHPVKPTRQRNSLIVKTSDLLIAAPLSDTKRAGSGTWQTIEMAQRRGVAVLMLWRKVA